jgi:hypothetical protein
VDQLAEICARHLMSGGQVVIPEPYIPYLPENWDGTLVVAEAQNLSQTNHGYVDNLKAASAEQRIRRLSWDPEKDLGVTPWDDTTLKLAVEAAFGCDSLRVAVSNAVLWSTVTPDGRNQTPSPDLMAASTRAWMELLLVLRPQVVVAAGAKAREVMTIATAGLDARLVCWPLPSPRVLAPLSGAINVVDLRRRFPEVDRVLIRRPAWGIRGPSVLYACLAVSATAVH